MQLSENFTLSELTASETAARLNLDNTAPDTAIANLERLARLLEDVRKILGKPVMINSAYRGPAVNEAVKGKKTSQHLIGCAADIRVPGMSPDEVCRAIIKSDIQFDQLIREYDSWTHISVPNEADANPRNQTLIIDKESPNSRAFI
jgi:hypothetical protein